MDNSESVQLELQNISNELSKLIDAACGNGFKPTQEQKEHFKALKKRIQLGAQTGKLPNETGAQTASDEYIFQPTMQNADRYFTLSTNAAPEQWADVLMDVQCSIDTSLTKNTP